MSLSSSASALVSSWSLGAIAQLVERFHGMEEVRGSIPLSSTRETCQEFSEVLKNPSQRHNSANCFLWQFPSNAVGSLRRENSKRELVRRTKRLTAKTVQHAPPGKHADGANYAAP